MPGSDDLNEHGERDLSLTKTSGLLDLPLEIRRLIFSELDASSPFMTVKVPYSNREELPPVLLTQEAVELKQEPIGCRIKFWIHEGCVQPIIKHKIAHTLRQVCRQLCYELPKGPNSNTDLFEIIERAVLQETPFDIDITHSIKNIATEYIRPESARRLHWPYDCVGMVRLSGDPPLYQQWTIGPVDDFFEYMKLKFPELEVLYVFTTMPVRCL